MIAGLGIDVVDVQGFRQQLADPATTFVEGTFTAYEREAVATRPSQDKSPHLAGRYAAKEAFIKAWSASNAGNRPALSTVDYRQIEVVADGFGRPRIQLRGEVARAVEARPFSHMHLSISHDGGFAAAVVVLERSPEAS